MPSLSDLVSLYIFSSGRVLYALQATLELANNEGAKELAAHIDKKLEEANSLRALEAQWARTPERATAKPGVAKIDNQADRILSAIRDTIVARATGAEPDEPIAAEATALVNDLFPGGVAAITTLAYFDELAAIDEMVKKLAGPLKESVKTFGLGELTARLANVAEKYRVALGNLPKDMDFSLVRAARAKCQDGLLQTVVLILAMTLDPTPDNLKKRAELLAPILRQNEEIRLSLRGRKTATDVDPSTGEPAEPLGPPAPEQTPTP